MFKIGGYKARYIIFKIYLINMNKSRENIIPFKKPGEEEPKVGKEAAEVEKETAEKIYKNLLDAYIKGAVDVSDIENYIKEFLNELELAKKENRPLPEEFGDEEVRAHYALLKDIRQGKVKKEEKIKKVKTEKKVKYELSDEEAERILIEAGFKEEYVKTMYEGKGVLEEMFEEKLTPERIANRAKEIKERLGEVSLSEQEIENQAKEELKTEALREFLTSHELVVRGVWAFNEKEKKWGILRRTNLDGRISLELLKLAGIDITKVKFVAPGDWKKGAINLDTGYRDGFVVQVDSAEGEKKEFIATTFFDHHGARSDSNTSSTKSIYETLVEFKLLEKTPEFDKLVEFVTQIDNFSYPSIEKYFEISDRTILGLQRFITFKNLLKYIKTGRSFTDILSDKDLVEYGFVYKDKEGRVVNRSKEQREIIDSSKKRLEWLKKNGFIVDTKYGKIVVDIESQLRGGQWATMAEGYDGYLSYNYKKGGEGFFLALNKGKLKDLGLLQGVLVRDTMYIQPRGKEKLHVALGDIIKKIISPNFRLTGALKGFLEKEKEVREGIREIKKPETKKKVEIKEPTVEKLKKEEIKEKISKEIEEKERREALIKKYEEILAKHPIHGKESTEEERRKIAERFADVELKELKEKI